MEKNLGHATAYGYAKSKGYSGTEEEFAQLMADYASVGQSAAQSAEQAAASATSASGSATTASQAAQTATSKASEAVTAAGTATTKASEASQSATSASQSAESAGTSAQTATTAASTATTKASEAAVSANTATTAKTDAETARDAAAQSASEAAASAESIDPDEFNRKIYAAFATDTASGAIASFPDGADSIPMKDVLVHIEPVQEGSGDPSPENVRPITGWTGAKVTRTGKNLLQTPYYDRSKTEYGITFTVNNDGSVSLSGTNNIGKTIYYSFVDRNFPKKLKKGSYSVGRTGIAGVIFSIVSRNADNTQVVALAYANETSDKVFTLSEDTLYYAYLAIDAGVTVNATFYPRLELGSTATDYEPYQGDTYDITFPSEAGTVGGGTLDVTSGVLTVDRAIWTGNTADMNNSEDYPGWKDARFADIVGTGINLHFPKVVTNVGFGVGINTAFPDPVAFMPKVFYNNLTQSDWIALAIDIQILLPLATPITYQLTPQEITSLLGENNVWADTGNTEVEYRASTKMYIDKKITEAVSALS